jgi:NRAMP (natural resistance-associated macrophage protein)-like metal ion transporter
MPTTPPDEDPVSAPTPVPTSPRKRRIAHRGRPHPWSYSSRWMRILGPGLITGAADDDPSGIGTYAQTGAAYGFGQIWLVLYMLPLMIAVQEMCGRIGLVTGQGIAGIVRKRFGRGVLTGAVGLLVIANTINIGADLGAMAAAMRLLIPAPYWTLLIIFALGIIALEIFVPYRLYARVLKLLALSLLAYVLTGIITQPNWGKLLIATVVPAITPSPEFLLLVVGILGTTISPYLFFWQASEEVEEAELHHWKSHANDAPRRHVALIGRLRLLRWDTTLGMLASEVTTWFIIVTTANTLHVANPPITNIQSADQAAQALLPLVHTFPNAGEIASAIFALGIVGTGLLAIPVLAGSAAYGVAEALGWHEGLAKRVNQARGFYGVIALATLVGMLVNVTGINPFAALVYTAILNGIIAAPLLILILIVANDKRVMGEFTNKRLSNTVGIITTLFMGIAAIVSIVSLFHH